MNALLNERIVAHALTDGQAGSDVTASRKLKPSTRL
jgi:hypothetical protein